MEIRQGPRVVGMCTTCDVSITPHFAHMACHVMLTLESINWFVLLVVCVFCEVYKLKFYVVCRT